MSNTPKTPADAGPGSSDQLGLVERLLDWADERYVMQRGELGALRSDLRAAADEIERLNAVARGNFEAAVDALDGCAIDVAAERERIASACWERRGHFASDAAARAFAELVRTGKAQRGS